MTTQHAQPVLPPLPVAGYSNARGQEEPLVYLADAIAALAAQQAAEPVAIPKGWVIARNTDGTIIVSNDHMGCAVHHSETVDRKIPSEVLHALCADLLAATTPPQALQPIDHPDTARCIKARNALNAALHGEDAVIDDLEHAVANVCAKLAHLQAVQPLPDHADHVPEIAARLRLVAKLAGVPQAVPDDDRLAVGAIFSVLGNMRFAMERLQAVQPQEGQ